mmetsp:Transcript_54403/g.128809  ORF Transcript_54403/g.128809 Transcript_54403/m.128809 type:complete len:202 (+) Transcript_54403:713-1318(+)
MPRTSPWSPTIPRGKGSPSLPNPPGASEPPSRFMYQATTPPKTHTTTHPAEMKPTSMAGMGVASLSSGLGVVLAAPDADTFTPNTSATVMLREARAELRLSAVTPLATDTASSAATVTAVSTSERSLARLLLGAATIDMMRTSPGARSSASATPAMYFALTAGTSKAGTPIFTAASNVMIAVSSSGVAGNTGSMHSSFEAV